MRPRRILSLWFPRMAVDRLVRAEPSLDGLPLAVVATKGNAQCLWSLTPVAQEAGLHRGMGLSDARALCPDLVTRPADPLRDADFLATLQRWAGKFSPWVSPEGCEALFIDITGCAHLFGGEEGLVETIAVDTGRLGLHHSIGIADTAGAAWAVARYAEQHVGMARAGDAIDQEARATRARAARKRRWEHLKTTVTTTGTPRIVPTGKTRTALARLPVAALRLDDDAVTTLTRLGLHTVADVAGLPRAVLSRRIGLAAMRRIDQALGVEPEPISPVRLRERFALRLSLPDPIGLEDDVVAAFDRLLEPLCAKLKAAGKGARRLQLTAYRADGTSQREDLGLARPSWDPERIRPLIRLKLREIDAGFGIDIVRMEACQTEPHSMTQQKGHVEAATEAQGRRDPGGAAEFDSLMSRLGTRIGLHALTRLAPAESHLPEKAAMVMAAAYCRPVEDWPPPCTPRPDLMFPPEPVKMLDRDRGPQSFIWRRRSFQAAQARGPERISPEWWLDDPNWRSGPRDYWHVYTRTGESLWLFEALGGETSPGWFMHGEFG